ncbi:transcription termination/antitermination NusG family protein [Bacillus sp. 1P06AnD]|uniref:transcription termination/antitermination NusG family protein n=1 Tax=Bacillus sp. 1P06AnD TaxID=3132208 RepID=UPI0039A38058
MAYFALKVTARREMFVKNKIEFVVNKMNFSKILDVFVPADIMVDLTSKEKKRKTKTLIKYQSYVFVNVEIDETEAHGYQEMSGEVYSFLSMIPYVQQVLTQSVDHDEMNEILEDFNCEEDHEKILFSVPVGKQSLKRRKNVTSLTKANAEAVKDAKKSISALNYFVSNGLKHLSYRKASNRLIICSPIRFLRKAIGDAHLTVSSFISMPYLILNSLLAVCCEENLEHFQAA